MLYSAYSRSNSILPPVRLSRRHKLQYREKIPVLKEAKYEIQNNGSGNLLSEIVYLIK